MLDKLIGYSLKNRSFVVITAVILAVISIVSIINMPIDAIPDITNVQVTVNARTGALDPEQVEKTVTYYIETELAGLPRVENVRSLSRFGLSQVTVIFREGTDIYWARQLVMEKLQNVRETLPRGITPELGPISTGLGEVFMYTVKERKGSPLEAKDEKTRLLYLRTVQDFVIRPHLKASIPNVAEIDAIGGYKKEIHVDFIPARLLERGITIRDILTKLETLGENYGGGYIERNGKQIIIRTDGGIDSLDAIRKIALRLDVYGRPVRLGDIAEIRDDHSQRLGAATHNGKEAVLGTVFMLLGSNSRRVALDAEKALKETPLPPDVIAEPVYSREFLVSATMRTVGENLAVGAALVAIILMIVLGNLRAALIVSAAIPLSMLIAATGMNVLGVSANLMSLGAIDFGLIVDGSVVMIENLVRRIEEKGPAGISLSDKFRFFHESCREVARPVAFGIIIIMAVYIPILSLEGIEGKMFRPMAMTVLMAIGASLAVAVILMPVLAYIFLKHGGAGGTEKPAFFMRAVVPAYRSMLDICRRRMAPVLGITAGVMILAVVLFGFMGSDFAPPLDEGDMSIAFVRDFSIGLEEAVNMQIRCENIIRRYGEVERVFSRMGIAETAADPMGINMGDTYVILKKDKSLWPIVDGRRRTKQELFEAIRAEVDKAMPGQEIIQSQPVQLRFNEILEGSRADVTLRIYGTDLEVLSDLVDKAEAIVKGVPGAEEVEMDPITSLRRGPFLNIGLDHDELNRYGVTIEDVNITLETAMGGKTVGSYYEQDRRFPIVVRMEERYRQDYKAIANIPVPLDDGGSIPLSRLTTIREITKVANIARNRSRRYSAVAITLAGRDMAGFVAEAKDKIERGLTLPQGYTADWGGQFRNLEKARARLALIVPLLLAAVFFILYRNFNSVRQALLVCASIPFAMTGGVMSLFARGMNFTVSAAVGFIALSGIAVLNSLVMVSLINQLRGAGMPTDEAVIEGSVARVRPIIMTALVASLGFLPMAVNTGMGAEVQRPLATVVIGGLITSTALTLFLVPMLYRWMEKEPR